MATSTKQQLLGLIDDIEIITKELFETIASAKTRKLDADQIETQQLLELLIEKDNKLQETMKTASEQATVQKKMDALQSEVNKRDTEILQLQKNLKDAETILSTAIYQAKQKLKSIDQANEKAIPSEELIKYAHKISASHSVAAPVNWAPGDPRRPYPTDLEMRLGFLGKVNDIPLPGQLAQSQMTFGDSLMASRPMAAGLEHHNTSISQPIPSTLSWQPAPELPNTMSLPSQSGMTSEVKGQNKENEDIEIMSTDSSSSSSSDE